MSSNKDQVQGQVEEVKETIVDVAVAGCLEAMASPFFLVAELACANHAM